MAGLGVQYRHAVYNASLVTAPGEGTLVFFIMDGNAHARHLRKLPGHLFIGYRELEILGLHCSVAVFAAITGEDNLSLVGFKNVAGVGEGIELAGFGPVAEHPPELEIAETCQEDQDNKSDGPADDFAFACHNTIYVTSYKITGK